MRKKIIVFSLFLIGSITAPAHGLIQRVEWTAQLKKVNATTYDIIFEAQMQTGWALYCQKQEKEDGPLPTTFIFQKNEQYQRVGLVKESWKNKKKEYDPVFEMVVLKYEKLAKFTQRVTISPDAEIIVMVEYMTCSATSCLPERYVEFILSAKDEGKILKPHSFIE